MRKTSQAQPNLLLKRERERCSWSQANLAEKIGVDAKTVGRWERGITSPRPLEGQKLCELFGKKPGELGLTRDKKKNSSQYIPYRRNPFFTGRENILKQLHDNLTTINAAALTQVQAIKGLGGIGKTQIAIEYAYRYRHDYHHILWAHAATRVTLITDFVTIASLLELPEKDEQDQQIVVNAVKHWLAAHTGWLLILDNADDLLMVSDFLPREGKGHILLTTHAQAIGSMAQSIEVEKMDKHEGTLFLLRRTGVLLPEESLDQAPEKEHIEAEAVVEVMDGLPLAFDQAGAYIEETGCSIAAYLDRYQKQQANLLKRRGGSGTDHPEPVATTWFLSFEQVEQQSPAAADLMRLCAFLAPHEIPEEMILSGASELGPYLHSIANDASLLDEAIGSLRRFSLIRRNKESNMLSVHRLVQAVLKESMSEEAQHLWAERTVRAVNRAFPYVKVETWSQCKRYLPHAQASADLISHYALTFSEAARLLHQVGEYLQAHAQYYQAEQLLEQACSIYELTLGQKHPDTASSLYSLARLNCSMGKYVKSEKIYIEARTRYEQILGLTHPKVAQVLNDLALLYYDKGEYAQAEPLCRQALEIQLHSQGLHHSDVSTTLNTLAWLYYSLGKYDEAEQLLIDHQETLEQLPETQLLPPDRATRYHTLAMIYRAQGRYVEAESFYGRALRIREELLGGEHPDVANILNDKAWLCRVQGRYSEAEDLYKRIMYILQQVLSSKHPQVATTLNDMVVLDVDRGKYANAEEVYLSALATRKQALGPEHPRVALCLYNLGWLYYRKGKYTDSESQHKQALEIRKEVLGLQHPDVGRSLNALAEVCRIQGKYTDAMRLFQKALENCEQSLKREHPHRATILNNLALLYFDQGDYITSEQLHHEALELREKMLGPEHPNVARSLNAIGAVYHDQGNYAKAEALFQRALGIREKVLGQVHPDVAQNLYGLGLLYRDQSNYAKAEALFQRALGIREKVLGQVHPDVAQSLYGLGLLYRDQSNYAKAEALFQRALDIYDRTLGLGHPLVAKTFDDLALLYHKQGNYVLAEHFRQRALDLRKGGLRS